MTKFRTIVFCGLIAIPATAFAEDLAPVALNSLSDAPANIASLPVMDQKGQVIGQALRVQTDQDGKPSALAFRAGDGSTVVIAAAATSYDGHALITSNDQPQIAALSGVRTAAAN
jgi:hypothetical protein